MRYRREERRVCWRERENKATNEGQRDRQTKRRNERKSEIHKR